MPRWAAVAVVRGGRRRVCWPGGRRGGSCSGTCGARSPGIGCARCMVQSRVMNHRGYVPWLLWVRPTNVGERVWLLMRPGICAEDVESRTRADRGGVLGAGCPGAGVAAAGRRGPGRRGPPGPAGRGPAGRLAADRPRRRQRAGRCAAGAAIASSSGRGLGRTSSACGGRSRPATTPRTGSWARTRLWCGAVSGAGRVGERVDAAGRSCAQRSYGPYGLAGAGADGRFRPAEPVARPSGAGAVSSSGEDVTDYV